MYKHGKKRKNLLEKETVLPKKTNTSKLELYKRQF
jgi:hypothetical protein